MAAIRDFDDFDCEADCETLNGAMKGMGTDEADIITVIASRSNAQRQELKTQFAQMFGKDLVDELKSELGGNFEDAVVAMFQETVEFDAWVLHDAISGGGTDEKALLEILCTRSNQEIEAIREKYTELYENDLIGDIEGDCNGSFGRLLYSLAQAARNEGDDVCEDAAMEDAEALKEAGEDSWGTDESRFNVVLATRSQDQMINVFNAYQQISDKTIEEAIENEMSGDIQDAMLAIVKCARYKPSYFAEALYKSMKGAGTDDKTLIRIMVSRSEVDLEDIKQQFEQKYEQTLDQFIEEDISGDYRMLMLSICQGN